MDPEKLNNNNFHNFIKQQKEMLGAFTVGKNIDTTVFEPEELFLFFNEHFDEFHQKENFRVVLSFIHRCFKVWTYRGGYLKDDFGILLINLLQEHNSNERDINIVMQIVYQFLSSFKYFGCDSLIISEKLLRELGAILLLIESRTLASNSIACMVKYMEMFPDSCKNLRTLWSDLKEKLDSNIQKGLLKDVQIDILIHLFDYFKFFNANSHDDHILVTTIQHLLLSDQRNFRKCGYFLFKKMYACLIESISESHQQHIGSSWRTYITILENLEEEQSHLILPTLENVEELVLNQHMHMSWLNVLYIKLLTHNNSLVLRWSLQFFLKTFSCEQLSKDTLNLLLRASNCNSLFNYEGYFLKDYYFASFLRGDITNLLTLFAEIGNWKSLPLYKWLENISKINRLGDTFKFGEILKLSACVRKVQNKIIRKKSIHLCNLLFEEFIEKMSINEYVMYIETLYNKSDDYNDHLKLFSKKLSIIQSEENFIFTQRFYEIFSKHPVRQFDQQSLLAFLQDIPVEKHGWLKYAPFQFELSQQEKETINNLYNLDLNNIIKHSLRENMNHFKIKLLLAPSDKNEVIQCERAAIAFYIIHNLSFKDEDRDLLNSILNSDIHNYAIVNFTEKCLANQQKIELPFIDKLLEDEFFVGKALTYLIQFYDEGIVRRYVSTIAKQIALNISIDDLEHWCQLDLLKEVTDELLNLIPSQGDKRIEEVFLVKANEFKTPLSKFYSHVILQLKEKDNVAFATNLLQLHLSLTKRKPRYFENTIEHRVKLRIAICMCLCFKNTDCTAFVEILSKIWDILLDENNQLNVTYIYEFILGIYENNEAEIMQKLNEAKYKTSRQQVSIITVAYTYFASHDTSADTKTKVTNILLSFSMGANFQTRLIAQLALYKLLKGKFIGTNDFQSIINSIEDAAGDKIEEYLSDIRFNFVDISECIIDAVLYITNAPYDELISHDLSIPSALKEQIECCHERFISKLRSTINEEVTTWSEVKDHLQRKINPSNDLTVPHNLIVYPTEEKSAEMYVVASLIDKLPNLGGIARTCEVLGITKLVMDSKMHAEKNEFKSLSMTAEKNLNIYEVKPKDLEDFLILKKIEGFNIVGAEQTCKSKSFNNFRFPEKCVLLLGHEKDGIPAPLLNLLDSAVEIPQFGQVRSLNVHVTGALFMWEYCKQHLIQK